MNELTNNKLNIEELEIVTGGTDDGSEDFTVVDIEPPYWVQVTVSSLNCRYSPDGEVALVYEMGHKLKVHGITTDGLWYRTTIDDPNRGMCDGYVYKEYTEKLG